jgi:5'-deoxynucleotidase YfbR-like HD superfamily hydrolase
MLNDNSETYLSIRDGYNVQRWHTQRRIRQETVGHHTASLAALVLMFDPSCRKEVLVEALMHDVAEVETGDTPATVKSWDEKVRKALDWLEDNFRTAKKIPSPKLDPEEIKLLAFCDRVESLLSAAEEVRMGNSYAKGLKANAVSILINMEVPTTWHDKAMELLSAVEGRRDV